ncbi:hypothetical protein Bbelb_312360 [Branchiostoma belcheri]|nr:hypothetical protein Bbelb_312360 [Branchiostoma belcheri]
MSPALAGNRCHQTLQRHTRDLRTRPDGRIGRISSRRHPDHSLEKHALSLGPTSQQLVYCKPGQGYMYGLLWDSTIARAAEEAKPLANRARWKTARTLPLPDPVVAKETDCPHSRQLLSAQMMARAAGTQHSPPPTLVGDVKLTAVDLNKSGWLVWFDRQLLSGASCAVSLTCQHLSQTELTGTNRPQQVDARNTARLDGTSQLSCPINPSPSIPITPDSTPAV